MKTYFLLFITFIPLLLFSQENYYPLECDGIIPTEFTQSTASKITEDNKKIDNKNNATLSRKEMIRFNEVSNFYIDYLLKSGKIIFGTPMNDYVNRVGKYVLQFTPEIKDEVRFYLVKSPIVNAFTNNQGIVFINIGLIAQLENEAQLAFVISHEIMHYKHEHSIEKYTESTNAKSGKGQYKDISDEKKVNKLLHYSRKNEFIADSLGFIEAYSKTEYSYDEALTLFDVLLYSNLPFDEITFDTTFFDDENYKLDSKYILKDINAISSPEDYDDKNMTHPNIKKRRNQIISIVTDYENENTKKFIISEADFIKSQKKARFEMSHLYVSHQEYDKAIYNSFLLLRDFPNNKFLKKTIAYSLYALSIQKNIHNISDVIQKWKRMEGQSQQLSFMLKKMDKKTLSSLAVKFLWELHIEYPDDMFVTSILNKCTDHHIGELNLNYHKIYAPIIVKGDSTQTNDDFIKLSDEEYNNLSKYDKIRYDKKYITHFGSRSSKKSISLTKKQNYKFILSTESTDKKFRKYLNAKEKALDIATESQGSEGNKTKHINIDSNKIVLGIPDYAVVKNKKFIIEGYEKGQKRITDAIQQNSALLNININIIDNQKFLKNDANKFNNLALMNAWFTEYQAINSPDEEYIITPWQSNYTKRLQKEYNTRYIASTGFYEFSNKNPKKIQRLIFKSLLFWSAIPYHIYTSFSKDIYLYHYFYCFDLKNNEIIFHYGNSFEGKMSTDYINGHIYHVLNKLKNNK